MEHGNCPSCGASLDGDGIWQTFYDKFTTGEGYWLDEAGEYIDEKRLLDPEEAERAADTVAASYGATRTKGRWGKAIMISLNDTADRVACHECREIWNRSTGKLVGSQLVIA